MPVRLPLTTRSSNATATPSVPAVQKATHFKTETREKAMKLLVASVTHVHMQREMLHRELRSEATRFAERAEDARRDTAVDTLAATCAARVVTRAMKRKKPQKKASPAAAWTRWSLRRPCFLLRTMMMTSERRRRR